jgi:ribose transport system substrate-binding protein
MNRRLNTLLALLSPLVFLAGCLDSPTPPPKATTSVDKGSEKGSSSEKSTEVKRIIFLTNGDDPFWDALNSGLKEGEKDFELAKVGLKAERDVNSATAEGQIKRLQQYASSNDIAGIAISVIQADNPAIVAEMRNLQKKGIPVITVDGDVNRSEFRDARQFYLGTDNIVGGRALGTAAKALLEARKLESGGYVQFAGFTDNDNARSRMNGFQEAVGAKFKEKDRMADGMDRNRAQDNVRSALTNHDDLVALVGIWAYNAPAIANVVEERKVRDKTTIITFDAQAVAIEDMAKGKIDAMVVQNPFDMGYQTVKLMKAMIEKDQGVIDAMFPNKEKPDGDIYTTGLRVVVPNAESPIKKELFDANVVEYMLLPDFQAWLKKYNLTSS